MLKDMGTNPVGQKQIPVKKIIVKDAEKDDATISIWSEHIPKVEIGRVYKMTNMRIDNFPSQKPHHISTTMSSKIIDITDEEEGKVFGDISLADGFMVGKVEVVHKVYVYDCCPLCTCKVDFSMIFCATCKKPLHNRSKTFKYEVCLDLGDDKTFNMTGFHRKSLLDVIAVPEPIPNVEDLEDILNNTLEQKLVKIEYTNNKKNKERIVHKMYLKN